MGKTSIEWTDLSWPVINGCRRVSPGCENCYAERLTATRLRQTPKYKGLAVYGQNGPRWTGATRLWAPALTEPLRIKKAYRIFVCDMGDLFFEANSNEEIAAVFGVMAACPRHTFQVLTKRPKRMLEWFDWLADESANEHGPSASEICCIHACNHCAFIDYIRTAWPLPNVWLGVSVENQKYADERIPLLLRAPARTRFLSCEPLLGPLDISIWLHRGVIEAKPGDADYDAIEWIICGGESGPGTRPMDIEWARALRDQCVGAGVPFHFKQHGGVRKKAAGRVLDGRTWDEFPTVAP